MSSSDSKAAASAPHRLSPLLAALLLAACSSSPPVQLYQLRADPPGAAMAPVQPTTTAWALGPVLLPEYLDRDAIVRPSGQSALQVTPTQRWAEPLRDAVPRLLQQDLAKLRGTDQVWRLPLPPGVKVERQLRVELQRFDAGLGGQSVVLQARWTLIDTGGTSKPQVFERRIEVASSDPSMDALVSAHRSALWQLAQAIVADTR